MAAPTVLCGSVMTAHVAITPIASQAFATFDIVELASTVRASIEQIAHDLAIAERQSRTRQGLAAGVEDELAERFRELFSVLDRNAAKLPESVVAEFVELISERFYPWVAASGLGERALHKPAGYAGDFQTIRMVYADVPQGVCWAGRFIDARILESPAAWAVKNRRALLADEIAATVDAAREQGRRARVASLGSGPAEELFDVWQAVREDAPERMPTATLVDMDFGALDHVCKRAAAESCSQHFEPLPVNIARAALGRSAAKLADQDLIYSAGLIDYFKDDLLIRLVDWIHAGLRPGGRTFLGNFHTDNPTRGLMESVLEWRLIHRDEHDMRRIFARSKFGVESLRISFDPSGVNMFVEATKAA